MLVGRDAELHRLERSYAAASAGRPQVVIIEAEAGMGKSALLEAFTQGHRAARLRWLRCDQFERDIAFAGAERLLGAEDSLTGCAVVEVGRRILDWVGEQQSGQQVLVLAVDDAQWLDRPSAQALAFALRRLRADRALTLITRRPGLAGGNTVLTEDPAATTVLRIGPLATAEVSTLAANLKSWQLSDDLAEALVACTGGVPLLMTAAIRGATGPDQLAPTQLVVAGMSSSGAVPPTLTSAVADAVAQLLDSVADDTRRLVEASAVLAMATEPVVLVRLARTPDSGSADPEAAIAAGLQAGLLRIEPDGRVRCAHDLLLDAVYRGLPAARRSDLHRIAAEHTTGDRQLAHRAAATAGRPAPELVVELVAAATSARKAQRHDLAAAHRLRARGICQDAETRDELLFEAIIDRVSAQELPGAAALAQTVAEGDHGALGSLALGLLARESGQIALARRLLAEALDRAVLAGDRPLAERAGLAKAVLSVRLNEGAIAIDSVSWAEASADPEIASDARTNKALGLWQLGRHEQAIAVLNAESHEAAAGVRASDDGATRLHDAVGGAPWDADRLAVRAMVRHYLGQLPEALADYDAAVALDPVWRPSTNHSRTRVLRARVRTLLGDWDGAAVDAASARTLAQSAAQAWSQPLAYAVSVDVPAWRGQFEVAGEYLAEAEAGLQVLSSPQAAAFVTDHRLTLEVARGDHAAVQDLLAPLLMTNYLDGLGIIRAHRWPMQCWIWALIEQGEQGSAEQALADYEQALARWPGGAVPARLGWLRGRLAEARGEPLLARDCYATDLLCPKTRQLPFFHAELLLASGHLERVLGNRREALDQLTKAHRILTRLRATPAEIRCDAELAACGLPTRSTNPLRLTPREEDVASLVARGYTNKEVAAELYLTAKTVEYHLSNIFAKLGITHRQQLRRLYQP